MGSDDEGDEGAGTKHTIVTIREEQEPAPPARVGNRRRGAVGAAVRRPAAGMPLRQVLRVNLHAAAEAIWGNRLRSGLTILGVVIGVASVIVLIAFAEGARQEVTAQIDTLGTNVAVVTPGKSRGEAGFNPMSTLGVSNLSHRDVEALRRTRGVLAVAPIMFVGGTVYRGDRPAEICLPLGTTPEFGRIRRLKVKAGRFLAAADEDQFVCVLGSGIARDLFKDEDPVGQVVKINRFPCRVIGVVEPRAVSNSIFGGADLDAIVYLPLAGTQRLLGVQQVHRIFVEVDARRRPGPLIERVRQAVLVEHKQVDDFSLFTSKDILEMFYKIFNLLAALLAGISSISLIVGGIGIMNIMLVSVTERTREIGIRKTVGARRRDIFLQFLSEAVALSAVGGVLGIGLAFLTCALCAQYSPLTPRITWEAVLLGVGVCVAVGILFGVAPAVKAARKDPIEAVRYE
jgi:putative ABC transport system permease protein